MADITTSPASASLRALVAGRLRALLGALTATTEAAPIDGEKAHAANLRRVAARRAADSLLR